MLVLAVVALVVAALGFATLTTKGRHMTTWLRFYAWKLASGQAHGGGRMTVNGVSIYYETYGAGPPVLIIHGAGGSIEGMASQVMALAASHLVVAADSRGHLRSTDSSAPMTYGLIADDLSKLLEGLRIEKADIVGWSDGGIVGLDLAMHHPDRVRRLVAISANFTPEGVRANPVGVTDIADAEIPPMPLRYRLLAPDPAQYSVSYRKIAIMGRTEPHYALADLGRITAKTLIVAGQNDVIRREHTDELAGAIPGSRKIIVAGASHALPWEKPGILNDYVVRFLDEGN